MLNAISFTVGLVLVCYVLLSYEDEEDKLRSWLDSAWLALDDYERGLSDRLRNVMQRLLTGLGNLYVHVYGTDLLSLRAFMASLSLCGAASLWLTFASTMDAQAQIAKVLEDIRGKFPGTPAAVVFYTEVGLGQLALIWTGLGLAFLGAFFLRPRWLQYCVIAAALVAYSLTLTWGVIGRAGLLDYLVAAVILSSVVDFFAVAAVRRLFEVAARQTKLRRVLSLTLVGTVAAPLLLIIAAEIARRGHLANFYTGAFQRIFFGPAPDSLLGPMAIVNAPAVVISISFVVVFLAAGIARLAYVVLPRALYSIIKLKVLCNRKATASIGVLLMGVAIPEASGMMEKTAKAIFG